MAFVNTIKGTFGEFAPILDISNAPSSKNILGVFGEFIPIFDPYSGDTTTYFDAVLLNPIFNVLDFKFQNVVFIASLYLIGSGGGGGSGSTPSDYVIVDGDVAQKTDDIIYTKLE